MQRTSTKRALRASSQFTAYQRGLLDGMMVYYLSVRQNMANVPEIARIRTALFVGDGDGSPIVRAVSPGMPFFTPTIAREIADSVPGALAYIASAGTKTL